MKNTKFLTFLFLFNITLFYAQTDSLKKGDSSKKDSLKAKIEYGVHSGVLISNFNWGLNCFAGPSIEKKMNFLAIDVLVGPKLIELYQSGDNTSKAPRSLNGLNLIYQFTPYYKNRFFNIFLQYQFIYRYYKEKGNASLWSTVPEPYISYYSLAENDLSLGFRFKFLRHFCLTTNFGAGIGYENRFTDFKHYTDITYKQSGLSFIASACLGYKFSKTKEKK